MNRPSRLLRWWLALRWQTRVAPDARLGSRIRWARGVRIGPGAEIGDGVRFAPGVEIGAATAVLPGSAVNVSMPSRAEVGGSPAAWLRARPRPEHGPSGELLAREGLEALLQNYSFSTVLDIGSGAGQHAEIMRAAGKEVTCIDLGLSHYASQSGGGARIEGDFLELDLAGPFDCVWASHVLEHQLNPNLFLRKVHSLLREGGVLAITVPPLKHDIVGGHLALWNPGLLLYHLVIAGFDCREAALRQYGYNITCLLVKKSIQLPELHMDTGDIERLKPFFPEGVEEPFDGRIPELNWPRAATGKAV